MLSPETLEQYRRMTPGQRLSLALRMTTAQTSHLFTGPPELVKRRFELLRRENDERNLRMCEALARAERLHEAR
jgi:hypothetical protein